MEVFLRRGFPAPTEERFWKIEAADPEPRAHVPSSLCPSALTSPDIPHVPLGAAGAFASSSGRPSLNRAGLEWAHHLSQGGRDFQEGSCGKETASGQTPVFIYFLQ